MVVPVLVLTALVVALPAAAATSINYPNFKSVKGLKLNGDAKVKGKALRLTSSAGDQAASVFTKKRLIKTNKPIKTSFRFHADKAPGMPADGLAFVLHSGSAKALGDGGGGIGYFGISKSVIVEFDHFVSDEYNDISDEHVAVIVNGMPWNYVKQKFYITYGKPNNVWIVYNPKAKKLKVWVTTKKKRPKKPLLSAKVNLKKIVGKKARAGFTAATGGESSRQRIFNWNLKAN